MEIRVNAGEDDGRFALPHSRRNIVYLTCVFVFYRFSLGWASWFYGLIVGFVVKPETLGSRSALWGVGERKEACPLSVRKHQRDENPDQEGTHYAGPLR